jgi:hypothetical protein
LPAGNYVTRKQGFNILAEVLDLRMIEGMTVNRGFPVINRSQVHFHIQILGGLK